MKTRLLVLISIIISGELLLQAQSEEANEKETSSPLMMFGRGILEKTTPDEKTSGAESAAERTAQARRPTEETCDPELEETEAEKLFSEALDHDNPNFEDTLTLEEAQTFLTMWQQVIQAYENVSEEYLTSLSPLLIETFKEEKKYAEQRLLFCSKKVKQQATPASELKITRTPGIYYLRPLTAKELIPELAVLTPSDPKMKGFIKLAQKIKEKREARLASTTKLFAEHEAIAKKERETDKKWRDLYNRLSKNIVQNIILKNPSTDWIQVDSAKKRFKKCCNRARQAMTNFTFSITDAVSKSSATDPHISNFEIIRKHADILKQGLDEHVGQISNAYQFLLDIPLGENFTFQPHIENIATLWNKAAAQAESTEYFWKMGAGYAKNVRLNNILAHANTANEGRYELGHVSSQEAQLLCESFVGFDFKIYSTDGGGTRLMSADKLKQSRFPEHKLRSEFTGWLGCRMANLERKCNYQRHFISAK